MENEDLEVAATAVAEDRGMVWEALPSADGPDGCVGDDWERAGVAERLSAAGAASAAADVVLAGSSATAPRGEARVNPPGHVWVSTVSRAMHAKRLEELWAKWKGNVLMTMETVCPRKIWIRGKSLLMISRS